MKFQKFALFLLILPLTILLDFIMYGALNSCPSCSSFTAFLKTDGALSFPMVVELSERFSQSFTKLLK